MIDDTDLDQLLGISNFILVAAPLISETIKIICARELGLMKRSAFWLASAEVV